jgi:hypothetical protein
LRQIAWFISLLSLNIRNAISTVFPELLLVCYYDNNYLIYNGGWFTSPDSKYLAWLRSNLRIMDCDYKSHMTSDYVYIEELGSLGNHIHSCITALVSSLTLHIHSTPHGSGIGGYCGYDVMSSNSNNSLHRCG